MTYRSPVHSERGVISGTRTHFSRGSETRDDDRTPPRSPASPDRSRSGDPVPGRIGVRRPRVDGSGRRQRLHAASTAAWARPTATCSAAVRRGARMLTDQVCQWSSAVPEDLRRRGLCPPGPAERLRLRVHGRLAAVPGAAPALDQAGQLLRVLARSLHDRRLRRGAVLRRGERLREPRRDRGLLRRVPDAAARRRAGDARRRDRLDADRRDLAAVQRPSAPTGRATSTSTASASGTRTHARPVAVW